MLAGFTPIFSISALKSPASPKTTSSIKLEPPSFECWNVILNSALEGLDCPVSVSAPINLSNPIIIFIWSTSPGLLTPSCDADFAKALS